MGALNLETRGRDRRRDRAKSGMVEISVTLSLTSAVHGGAMKHEALVDNELARARATGRYALRRWEVNFERADEWDHASAAAADAGQSEAAMAAACRQRAFADLAHTFHKRYGVAAGRVRRLAERRRRLHERERFAAAA
jgi:hypothetical protein